MLFSEVTVPILPFLTWQYLMFHAVGTWLSLMLHVLRRSMAISCSIRVAMFLLRSWSIRYCHVWGQAKFVFIRTIAISNASSSEKKFDNLYCRMSWGGVRYSSNDLISATASIIRSKFCFIQLNYRDALVIVHCTAVRMAKCQEKLHAGTLIFLSLSVSVDVAPFYS